MMADAELGYACAGLSPAYTMTEIDGKKSHHDAKVLYNEGGRAFILFEKRNGKYTYKGIVLFYESTIPKEYKKEFKEFYDKNFDPPYDSKKTSEKIGMAIFKNFMDLLK